MSWTSEARPEVECHPLTAERWGDLINLFGPRGATGGCWCMYWRLPRAQFTAQKGEGNKQAFRDIVAGGEMVGLLAAVERYLKVDHDAEMRELEGRVEHIISALSRASGIRATRHVPVIANEVPHVQIEWDERAGKVSSQEAHQQLLNGDPPIHVQRRGPGQLLVSVWMMRAGEHRVVAKRLKEILG